MTSEVLQRALLRAARSAPSHYGKAIAREREVLPQIKQEGCAERPGDCFPALAEYRGLPLTIVGLCCNAETGPLTNKTCLIRSMRLRWSS